MKKNKPIIILSVILLVLIIIIILLMVSIRNKSTFKKPEFDKNATSTVPTNLDYQSKIFNVTDNYSIYIEPEPVIKNNNDEQGKSLGDLHGAVPSEQMDGLRPTLAL